MPIPYDWNIPQVFRDRMGERAGRQRSMEADGHLLLVLHKLPQPGQPEREGAFFWRTPDGEWNSTRGMGIGGLRKHVEEFAAAIDTLESDYESASAAADYFTVIQAIVPIHRSASHLHAVLQSAREAVPHDRDLLILRDRAGEVERAAELLHSDAQNALNYSMARRGEEMTLSGNQLSQAGHRINMLAAIFLPLTAVGSIFGMNLTSGLEGHTPFLFWGVLLIGGMLGYALHSAFSLRHAPAAPPALESPKSQLPARPRQRGIA